MTRYKKTIETERTALKIDEINLHRFTAERAQAQI